ncbi:MAG: NACHT domain-containing protein [Verrucomicrobia bacterium]|nr:NACHT domain-containing protein [Verrucomicrobiota bacterium]
MGTRLDLDLLYKRAGLKPNEKRFYTPAQLTQLESVVQSRMGAVCQIKTPTDQGTGCLIGGDLLITNYHVIRDVETAKKSEAIFFRVVAQDADKNRTTVEVVRLKLDPSRYFYQSLHLTQDNVVQPADAEHLDFTLVALDPHPYLEEVQCKTFNIFKNIELKPQALTCILQHPDVLDSITALKGDLKWSIGLVQGLENCSVLYDTETAPGSSGGAVTNIHGDLVALHHQGLGKRNLDPQRPYSNAGVLMTEIVKDLERKRERARIEELVAAYKRKHPSLEAQLTHTLKTYYKTFDQISLISENDETLPIQNYAPLLMIGESERKKKCQSLDQPKSEDGHLPYEAQFKSKEPIKLDLLFEYTSLKDSSEKRALILGAAGVGKSTLCQYIAYRWSTEQFWPQYQALFWIKLRYLTENFYPKNKTYTAYDLLVGQLLQDGKSLLTEDYQSLLQDKQFRDKVLLILDGDDELPSEIERGEGHLSSAFENLKKLFPHVLITSRPQTVSFGDKPAKATLELIGFDQESIDKYIADFFADPKFAIAKKNLRSYFDRVPLLNSLAHIPMNLAILCRLFREEKNAEEFSSPDLFLTTSSLYREITNWFCKRFLLRPGVCKSQKADILRDFHPHDLDEIAPIFKSLKLIAWEAMKKNQLYLTESEISTCFVKFKLHINQNKNFGLFKIDQNIGSFIHLTFQEYLAALYLADLYLLNLIEGQRFIAKHKFTPRYALIFWMAAGDLSTKDPRALQRFFNDLLSEPYDLAVGYELRLVARCFEECQDPMDIKQYSGFIKQVILYLQEDILEELKAAVLIENPRLFQHAKAAEFFEERIQTNQEEVVGILYRLASKKQIFSERILLIIIKIIKDSKASSLIRSQATSALKEVVKNGQVLPLEAADAISGLLLDLKASSWVQRRAADTLVEVVRSGQALPQKVVEGLVELLRAPGIDSDIQGKAVIVLREVAKSGSALPKDTIIRLLELLRNSQITPWDQYLIVEVLGEIAVSDQVHSREATEGLIALVRDPIAVPEMQILAANTLIAGVISKQTSQTLKVKEALRTFLQDLLSDPQLIEVKICREIAKSDRAQYGEAVKGLIALVRNRQVDSWVRGQAAEALGEVVKSDRNLVPEVVDGLLALLRDLPVTSSVKCLVVTALGKIAKSELVQFEEVVEDLLAFVINPDAKSDVRVLAIKALEELAKSKQALPSRVVNEFFRLSQGQPADSNIRIQATCALGEVLKSGQILSQDMVEGLFMLSQNPEADSNGAQAVSVLVEVVKNGQALPQKVVEGLLAFVKNDKAGSKIRGQAACTLGEMAKNKQTLPLGIVEGLFMLLRDPEADSEAQSQAAEALGKIAQSGQPLPQKVKEGLFAFLRDPQIDPWDENRAVSALGDMAKSEQGLSQQDLETICNNSVLHRNIQLLNHISDACCKFCNSYESQILRRLFFLTGRAFFYQDGGFFTSGNERPLAIKRSLDLEKVYREHLQGNQLHPESFWKRENRFFNLTKVFSYLPLKSFYQAYKVFKSKVTLSPEEEVKSEEMKKHFLKFITKNGIRQDVQFIESYSTNLGEHAGTNFPLGSAAVYFTSGLDRYPVHWKIIGERELLHLQSQDRVFSCLVRGVIEVATLVFLSLLMRGFLHRSSSKLSSLVISFLKTSLSSGVAYTAGGLAETIWTFYTEIRTDRDLMQEASPERMRAGIDILKVEQKSIKRDWKQIPIQKKISAWVANHILAYRIGRMQEKKIALDNETEEDQKAQNKLLEIMPRM